MAKTILKAVCSSIVQNDNSGQVQFIIEDTPLPAAKAGDPPTRRARTIISLVYSESKKVALFEHKKTYTITIE